MVVREGTNVTLTCKAKGFPEPYVMWRREDGDEMSISGENGERAKARFPRYTGFLLQAPLYEQFPLLTFFIVSLCSSPLSMAGG
jgi:Immunoglobulin domain